MGEGAHIKRNLFQFYQQTALLNDYQTGEVEGIGYVWNREGTWPAYLLGYPRKERIHRIVESITLGEVPPFWIMEKKEGEEARLLEKEGVRAIREWKGMALSRHDLRNVTLNSGIEIRSNDQGINRDWTGIVNNELMTGKSIGDRFLNKISVTGEFSWVVAYLGKEAAGTGLSYASGGVAGIYMISTVKKFRGRGVGTKITRVLTEEALESGNQTVVLHATGQGEGIYRSSGFREVSTLQVMWLTGR